MLLKLTKGEIMQVAGPVTGRRYTFERRIGVNIPVEVDDKDVPGLLAKKAGCCGSTAPLFVKVDA
jgi:hypothetical protein